MERATDAGVLHIAAAGNSGAYLEATPEYPAAFEGRGILAVAATDANDAAPNFTNFGYASVDLAAPGVSVLSTVPSGTCTYCDATGFKLLSGTSMAAPHVAGVAAALFHLNPLLTPAEARDVLLDPASVDPLSSPSVRTASTTHARLSFAKAIANPLVSAPHLNGFPQLSVPSLVTRSVGSAVTLSTVSSEPDGDPLQQKWGKNLYTFLFGNMMNQIFPPGWIFPATTSSNPYVFTAPALARTASIHYKAVVNDGRGGSAAGSTWVNVLAAPTPGQPPSGSVSVTPASGPPGTVVTVSYSGSDPEGGSLLWGYASGAGGNCCYPLTQTFNVPINSAGVYRFSAQSIDPELNLSSVSSAVVRIGNALGEAPVADVALDVTSGPAPLTVTYDATGSYDPDGGALTFFPECEAWTHGVIPAAPPIGTCTFDTPGPHSISIKILDTSGYWDERIVNVMVTPVIPADGTPPTAQISSPAAGASLTGSVAVDATASDDVGVMRVEIYRDNDVLLGTDTTAPYSATWDTATAPPGDHTLYARAYDQAGNVGTSAARSVRVRDAVPPAVSLTSPAAGASVSGSVTLAATAADDVGVVKVEFFRDSGVLLGTDTTAPYGASWDSASVAPGNHTLYAKAYDQDNVTTSASITVNVLDVAPPTVAITSPVNGSTVAKNSTVTISASASDNVGVARVEFYVGTTLKCTDTTSPFTCAWSVPKGASATYSLQAKAYDAQGNVGTSAVVQVTSH